MDNVFEVKTVDDIEFANGEVPVGRNRPTDFRKNVVNVLWKDDEMYETVIQEVSGR